MPLSLRHPAVSRSLAHNVSTFLFLLSPSASLSLSLSFTLSPSRQRMITVARGESEMGITTVMVLRHHNTADLPI